MTGRLLKSKMIVNLSSEILGIQIGNHGVAPRRRDQTHAIDSRVSLLEVDHLFPETQVRSDYGPSRLHVEIGLPKVHVFVFYQIDYTQRCRPRHPCHAVHQRLPSALFRRLKTSHCVRQTKSSTAFWGLSDAFLPPGEVTLFTWFLQAGELNACLCYFWLLKSEVNEIAEFSQNVP